MAFITKVDYCGLARSGSLVCASATQGKSGTIVQAEDDTGSYVAETYVAGGAAASNEYDVKGEVAFTSSNAVKLGTVNTVGTSPDEEKFMLTGVTFGTSSTDGATFSATAEKVESGATTGATYAVPDFTLPKRQKAAMLFSEATLTGNGCYLTSAAYSATATANVKRDEDGTEYASDIHGGVLTSTLNINQTSSTVPTIAAASGWIVSSPLTQTNSKGAYPTWTVTLSKDLVCTEPST